MTRLEYDSMNKENKLTSFLSKHQIDSSLLTYFRQPIYIFLVKPIIIQHITHNILKVNFLSPDICPTGILLAVICDEGMIVMMRLYNYLRFPNDQGSLSSLFQYIDIYFKYLRLPKFQGRFSMRLLQIFREVKDFRLPIDQGRVYNLLSFAYRNFSDFKLPKLQGRDYN